MNNYDIIKKPLMSEKSYANVQNKIYTFVVDKNANKVQSALVVSEYLKEKINKISNISIILHKNLFSK